MTEKKKRRGDISHVFSFDIDTFELDDFEWDEGHEAPPFIKPKIQKKKPGEDRPC